MACFFHCEVFSKTRQRCVLLDYAQKKEDLNDSNIDKRNDERGVA